MNSHEELIEEATAHIEYTTDSIGPQGSEVRAAWARGEGSDERFALVVRLRDALAALTTGQGIDAPSVREAIGEVLADMGAVIEGMPVASDLAALTEITDAAIRAAVSPPSRTAKRTGYETVGHAVGEHSQTIRATAAITTPQEGDARERLHAKCDCVPDLGPAHCHLCGNEKGEPVPWPECSAVRAAAPEPDREAQLERVAARLREIVYLCGDDLGCQCEEAQDASANLARELSIIAAERPTLTADEVWAIAKAEHDYANDSDNVPAFVDSLTDALRTAGVAFDEQPFIDSGYLLPVEGESCGD